MNSRRTDTLSLAFGVELLVALVAHVAAPMGCERMAIFERIGSPMTVTRESVTATVHIAAHFRHIPA